MSQSDKQRARFLRTAFNLSVEEWDQILEFQDGKCFICRKSIRNSPDINGKPRPHTDHDHKTGIVRGLLCSQCNRALGKAQDPRWAWSPECFRMAWMYLLKPPAIDALGGPRVGYPGIIGTKKYRKWAANKNQMKLFE